MDQYWNVFYVIMGILVIISIFSGFFANRIKAAMKNLEFYSNGKETAHHSYIPYD
ncbi:MAG: hypothetical protein FWC60_10880 [Firmicutes bacterium]|nr:hypothetical protein [Bacillota bacterium]